MKFSNHENIYHITHASSEEEIEQIIDFVRKTGHLPDGSDPTDGDIELILDAAGNLAVNGKAVITLDRKENMEVKTDSGKEIPFRVDDAEDMVFYV